MATDYSITQYFGRNLAELLAGKISPVYPDFDSTTFCDRVEKKVKGKTYTQRIDNISEILHEQLPSGYEESVEILISILGEENADETGMFKHFYWIMPIGKFVEKYGLGHFELSINAIQEITKRNTGEYAIRPYIRTYPGKCISQMKKWAKSDNFHLRRLASEGLRPKLPWASKLDTFIDNPQPVFEILDVLKQDTVLFVKKSVANHLTDWLKVNKEPTVKLMRKWELIDNKHTQWIIKRATRKIKLESDI